MALLAMFVLAGAQAGAQCQGALGSLENAARCTARTNAPISKAEVDPAKPYRLEELIDIAESNNPQTRIAWEQAKQAADRLGIARSDYFPQLAALALGGDQRVITPFPRPLAPSGYYLIELPVLQSGVEMTYNVFDFGRRGARIEDSKAIQLARAAAFQRVNQDIAFRVVSIRFLRRGGDRSTMLRHDERCCVQQRQSEVKGCLIDPAQRLRSDEQCIKNRNMRFGSTRYQRSGPLE